MINKDPISRTPSPYATKGPKVSYLFSADDLTLFSRSTLEDNANIINTLNTFCAASGPRLNHRKFKCIFSGNCNIQVANVCSSILKIHPSTSFGKYLGFPIMHYKPTHADFQFIIDNRHNRLAGWKAKILNMTGKLSSPKTL